MERPAAIAAQRFTLKIIPGATQSSDLLLMRAAPAWPAATRGMIS
jgi:hypothetical protein